MVLIIATKYSLIVYFKKYKLIACNFTIIEKPKLRKYELKSNSKQKTVHCQLYTPGLGRCPNFGKL